MSGLDRVSKPLGQWYDEHTFAEMLYCEVIDIEVDDEPEALWTLDVYLTMNDVPIPPRRIKVRFPLPDVPGSVS